VTMKDAALWDVAPCRSCSNRRFGGTYRLHLQGRKIRERGTSASRWFQTGSSLMDFSTLKTEAICSTETSVHTRTTRPENSNLYIFRYAIPRSFFFRSVQNSTFRIRKVNNRLLDTVVGFPVLFLNGYLTSTL
jgi:hypothetical protein